MTTVKDAAAPPQAEEHEIEGAQEGEDASLERLLEHVPGVAVEPPVAHDPGAAAPQVVAEPGAVSAFAPKPADAAALAAGPALRTARVAAVRGREAEIAFRGRGAAITATIDEGVDPELVKRAMAGNEAVLVEVDPEVGPVIVGVVQTRVPDVIEIKARKVVLDADEELLMRAGRGAMRIREDGDVELVGSRISTLSRGLFRIVGRVLRLN